MKRRLAPRPASSTMYIIVVNLSGQNPNIHHPKAATPSLNWNNQNAVLMFFQTRLPELLVNISAIPGKQSERWRYHWQPENLNQLEQLDIASATFI